MSQGDRNQKCPVSSGVRGFRGLNENDPVRPRAHTQNALSCTHVMDGIPYFKTTPLTL